MAGFNVNVRPSNGPLGSGASAGNAAMDFRNRFNAGKMETPIPGAQAAEETRGLVAPMETPVVPFPQEGQLGVMGAPPLTENSTNMEQAQLSQSPLATTNAFNAGVYNEATGNYEYSPETLGQRADERSRQMSTLTDASSVLDTSLSPEQIATNIMGSKATASHSEIASKLTGVADPANADAIPKWADTMGPAIAVAATNAQEHIMNGIFSAKPGREEMPEGLQVLAENGLDNEQGLQAVGAIMGLAGLRGVSQLSTFRKEDVVVDPDSTGRPMEDARSLVNTVNGISAAAKIAFDRAGINMPMEGVRRLANAHIMGELRSGNLLYSKDDKGNTVIKASDRMKKLANETEYLLEALHGSSNRPGVSYTTNIAGAAYTNPGSQTTSGSLSKGGTTTELVKHILGQIKFEYLPKDILFKEIQLKDLSSKMILGSDGLPQYSESGFASSANVSKKDYEALRNDTNPPADYNPNDPAQVTAYERAKDQHASEEIQNKLDTLAYDIATAKGINKPFSITHSHSTATHRYFEMTKGADALSSKYGVRELRNFADRDVTKAAYLFDTNGVERVKAAARELFAKKGNARNQLMHEMQLPLKAAVAVMFNAVVNYYTVVNPDPKLNIVKHTELNIINMYTPEIGAKMADLGRQYNEYLAKPEAANPDFMQYLYGMPRGEALANKNLWDDMFQLSTNFADPAKKDSHTKLSYMNFDDGNQNGIFFQGLFFGSSENVIRLGTFNPSLEDMRGYAANKLTEQLDSLMHDRPTQLNAWKSFMKAVNAKPGFKSDFFKAPLMKNSYGLDASMFKEHVLDFLANPDYASITADTLFGAYNENMDKIATDLTRGLEGTLRTVVNQNFAENMKAAGRFAAILNAPIYIDGVDGEKIELTPVGIMPSLDPSKDEFHESTDEAGNPIGLASLGVKTMDFRENESSTETLSVPIATTQAKPTATKGIQSFFDRTKGTWNYFKNYIGSSLAKYMVVMPIQATDGGTLGLTILAANKLRLNKMGPVPAAFVHDGISSTGSGAMVYRNAYNNIAIPQAIPEIAQFATRLDAALKKAKSDALAKASQLPMVGIGEDGHYPAMGALFDEAFDKIQENGPYHERFIERKMIALMAKGEHVTEKQAAYDAQLLWDKFVATEMKYLDEARSFGWKPAGSMPEVKRAMLAVRPDKFAALVKLAEEVLQIDGPPRGDIPKTNFKQFVNGFKAGVEKTAHELMNNALVKQAGIAQMTVGGGKPKKAAPEPSGNAVDWTKRIIPQDKSTPAELRHTGEGKSKKQIRELVSKEESDLTRSVIAALRGRDFMFSDLKEAINTTEAGTQARKDALYTLYLKIKPKIDQADTSFGSYMHAYEGLKAAVLIPNI